MNPRKHMILKISILTILVIMTLYMVVSIFYSFTMIYRYLPILLLLHTIFFGIRILSKIKWIGFIPSILLLITTIFLTGYTFISNGFQDNFTNVILLIFGVLGILVTLSSFMLSMITEQFFLDTRELGITKTIKHEYDKIVLVLGSAIWIFNYFDPAYRYEQVDAPWYGYFLITLIIGSISGIICTAIYFIMKKKYQLLIVSLGSSFIFYIFHFLISYTYFRMMISMGVILWLIIVSLMTLIDKKRNKNTQKIIEEGEFV